MKAEFTVIIPSRYGSTRFPGKPLADIEGRPMVVRVAERARAAGATRVCVATDDARIAEVVSRYDFQAIMTRPDHETGTDRLAEVVDVLQLAEDDIVVNVQGDEPLIEPALIRAVAELLRARPDCAVATAAYRIQDAAAFWNPSIVKVVVDAQHRALYFSRAPIPWARTHFAAEADRPPAQKTLPEGGVGLHHIGIYAYRVGFLRRYPELPQTDIERLESLEQLRALWHGYPIAVFETDCPPAPGVDHPEDLETVLTLWRKRQSSVFTHQ